MAALDSKWPTLVDVANSMDPNGKTGPVAEILTETNEMLLDIPWFEGNLPTGHRTSIRTGLPAGTFRQYYGGVQPDKSTRAQVTENTCMLEAYAEIDKALADLNGNTAAFRLQEDSAFIEGMSQQVQDVLIYGDANLQIEKATGFAPRYNSLSAANAENIIVGGGSSTDNASIWLVVWGPGKVFGIFPKGSKAGLSMDDKGQVTIENVDGNGGRMEAYRTHYKWDFGLCVADWRYVIRIPNIDRSALTADLSGGANIADLMFQAMQQVPSLIGRPVFYMDRSLKTMLGRQLAGSVKQSTLTTTQVGGVLMESFHGIPIRRVDKMRPDEARVV
jgi:hypothetical protein